MNPLNVSVDVRSNTLILSGQIETLTLALRVIARGKPGHSSEPGKGVNAIHAAARAIAWVADEQDRLARDGRFDAPRKPTAHCPVNWSSPSAPSAASLAAIATPIKSLRCPSDITAATRNDAANVAPTVVALTSYKGISGGNWGDGEARWLWGTPNGPFSAPVGTTTHAGILNGNGMFFRADYLRKLKLSDITDGTSNTMMVGEDVGNLNQHLSWPYSNNAVGTCGIAINSKQANGTAYNYTDWPNVYSFRSMHTGGAQFALADASVRFVRESVNITSYRNLCSIQGGELGTPDD